MNKANYMHLTALAVCPSVCHSQSHCFPLPLPHPVLKCRLNLEEPTPSLMQISEQQWYWQWQTTRELWLYSTPFVTRRWPTLRHWFHHTSRAAHSGQLIVDYWMYLERYDRRSFSCAGPTLWNVLPEDLRLIQCMNTFKSTLKTRYSKLANVVHPAVTALWISLTWFLSLVRISVPGGSGVARILHWRGHPTSNRLCTYENVVALSPIGLQPADLSPMTEVEDSSTLQNWIPFEWYFGTSV